MKLEPTLTSRAFLPLLSGLRRLGHDPVPLLAAVGVEMADLDDPDRRIPMSAGSGLLARAAVATRDDSIGLHLAEHADLRTVDVHFYDIAEARFSRGCDGGRGGRGAGRPVRGRVRKDRRRGTDLTRRRRLS